MRSGLAVLLLMCAVVAGCTKRNPELCCVTPAECTTAGFDSPQPCAQGVCVANSCQASGCDGDEDCAQPMTCSAGQCVAPPDWEARHGGPEDDQGKSIAAATNGDLVMTGTFSGTASFGGDPIVARGTIAPWIARYRADGDFLWSVTIGDAALALDNYAAVDGNGDVYVAGAFGGPADYGSGTSSFSGGLYLVKLSGSDGSHQWDRVLGPSVYVNDLVVLDANNIAICGLFFEPIDFGGGVITPAVPEQENHVVAVYNTATGAYAWAKSLGAVNNTVDHCHLIAIDNDLIVTGIFQGTAMLGGAPLTATGSADFFVERLRGSDGSHVWSVEHGGSGATTSLSIASDGTHVFVGGTFSKVTNLAGTDLTAAGMRDAFVASYSAADGSPLWARSFGGAGALCNTTSLAATSNRLAATIDFSLAPITIDTQALTPKDGDIAIVRFNPATGVPSTTPSQFTMSTPTPPEIPIITMSLAYTFDHLAGVGAFGGGAKLFGSTLLSAGKSDVASFRVDF